MSVFVDIEKSLGAFQLRVKFEAGEETLALLGASGCGKSMTLKCIAGIERPDRGRIVVDDVVLFDSEKHIDLSPQQRHTGLMFQNYALFPNMTVLQNIRTGASREPDRKKREASVRSILERFGLEELAGRYPHQLSGGQQQRVALARILVSNPRILLLDEPFSALDSHLRFRLEQEVKQELRRFGKSVILVSHDRDEVFRMSQQVAIMAHGSVQATGTNRQVFSDPQTRVGASLTGCKFISDAIPIAPGRIRAVDWDMELDVPERDFPVKAVGIRMNHVILGPGENEKRCRVVDVIENSFNYTLLLRPWDSPEGIPFGCTVPREVWLKNRTQEVCVCIPRDRVLLLRD